MFIWSFKSRLKLGPLIGTVSVNIIGRSSKVTWYAIGSSNKVTIHNKEFKSNSSGKDS